MVDNNKPSSDEQHNNLATQTNMPTNDLSRDELQQDRTPEDIERSERLFEKLAAEEPPIDLENDTAAGRTAPHEAVHVGNTRPVQAMGGRGRQFMVTLVLGAILVMSLVVTVFIFLQGEDDSQSDSVNNIQAQAPSATPSALQPSPTQVPTEAAMLAATEGSPPPEVVSVPTATLEPRLAQFVVELPPTAAVDERGAWLRTPVVTPPSGGDTDENGAIIQREDNAFTITGETARTEVVPYTVQSNDTLTSIAETFGIEICTIVWSNPRNRVSPLRPGNVIDILPVDGVLYKVTRDISIQQVADETAVTALAIIDSPYNDLFGAFPETVLVEGMKIIVPGGDGGNCNVWAPKASVAGSGAGGSGAGGAGGGGGSLWGCAYSVDNPGYPGMNPVGGSYTFFQGFTAAHTGVDLAASTGTAALASGNGSVAYAGWNEYGYGNVVVIDHGTGTYTLYAHLSAINVSCGQSVSGGSRIGSIGSTGRSSGPHLHFEIRDAGFNPINPTNSMAF